MSDKSKLKEVPLELIHENPIALRSVNRQDEQFIGLVDSIREHGVLNPILLRELKNADTGETYFGLIDGLQRFTASKDAGRETISAKIVDKTDAEVLEAQIITNIHKVDTKPIQYTNQLIRILAGDPLMTVADLARKLAKSPSWLSERLGLVNLTPSIAKLVDDNKINLSNAYALAKLPEEEQPSFVDRAMTMTPQEFLPQANNRVKEIKDAKRQGRDPNAATFTPMPHLRKLSEIKEEWENPRALSAIIARDGITDPVKAAQLVLSWTLHMDADSQAQAHADHNAQVEKRKAERERRAEEARQKRAQSAAEAQVEVESTVPA